MTRLPKKILSAVDLSPISENVLKWTQYLARFFQSEVTVLHASSYEFPPYYLESSPSFKEEVDAHWETLTDSLEERTASVMGEGISWQTVVFQDHPIDAILNWSEKNSADLLILGSRGRSGAAKLLLGSVSENILQLVGCPTLVVREASSGPEQLERILCPVDLSYSTQDSINLGSALSAAAEAQLYLLHTTDTRTKRGLLTQEVKDWLSEEAQERCQSFSIRRKGDAPEQIIQWARQHDVDLVVVGAKYRPFLEFTTLQPETERILRYSPCSVLIVPYRS